MAKEEKYHYIFEDTRFEGRPRFNWVTDCLLGDIRTFLDGIENYTDNKEKFAFKPLPRGGGNLSVPILISTALEFVSALYAGKTKYIDKSNYNATQNAKEFIEKFFPEKYKEIPLLIWDGIRNGLVHTFYSKFFESSGNYIGFQFFVEDRNAPSSIKKVNNTIVLSINVFELYRIVENAVIDYREELKQDETLQDKFIRTWSSIEQYTEEADPNQSKEAKVLLDYLSSSSGALLFIE